VGSTYQQKTTTENNALGVNNNQSNTVVGSTAVPQVVSESQWSNGYYDSNGSYVYGTATAQPIVSNNAPNNYSYGVSGSQQVALDGASTQYYGVNYNASTVNVAGGVPQPLMNTVTEGNTSYAWNYYQVGNGGCSADDKSSALSLIEEVARSMSVNIFIYYMVLGIGITVYIAVFTYRGWDAELYLKI